MWCAIPGCSYVSQTEGEDKGFHIFPSDPVRKEKWLAAIRAARGDNYSPCSGARLCSDHFLPTDYHPKKLNQKLKWNLRRDAIPSIFRGTKHGQEPVDAVASEPESGISA